MGAIVLQLLNGLEKGAAYALIALGLTLVFGTLGVVNFAHGALFMLGAFIAVGLNALLTRPVEVEGDGGGGNGFGFSFKQTEPWAEVQFGEFGAFLADWSVVISVLLVVPLMLLIGYVMERGLIRHFYKRPHADQILVTFGLAIVIGELVKHSGVRASIRRRPHRSRAPRPATRQRTSRARGWRRRRRGSCSRARPRRRRCPSPPSPAPAPPCA